MKRWVKVISSLYHLCIFIVQDLYYNCTDGAQMIWSNYGSIMAQVFRKRKYIYIQG